MRTIWIAELRGSLLAWASVAFTLVVVNFTLTLAASVAFSGQHAISSGQMIAEEVGFFVFTPITNMVLCTVVGATAISSVTALVLDTRRGALARLVLAGATPRQLVRLIVGQLAMVSVAASTIGASLALVLLEPTLAFLAHERRAEGLATVPEPVYRLLPIVAAVALSVAVAVIGGARQAITASRTEPVQALRDAQHDGAVPMGPLRWAMSAVAFLVVVGGLAALPSAATSGVDALDLVLQISLLLLVVSGMGLAAAAPALVGPVTAVWTRLAPLRRGTWAVARHNTIVRGSRLAQSVVPIMFTVGLLTGALLLVDLLLAARRVNGTERDVVVSDWATLLVFLGLPLFVAFSGAVSSLIIAARQRDAELALLGMIGATPGQRLAMPAIEGLLLTVTGPLLAAVMWLVSAGALIAGINLAGSAVGPPTNPWVFVISFGGSLIPIVATIVLPTLRARELSEPEVLAGLVAD